MKTNCGFPVPGLGLVLAAGLVVAGGCAKEVTKLTDENNLRVHAVADTFTVDIDDLDNLYEELSWDWPVTTPVVHVEHRSFAPHGEHRIRLLDADGNTVYDRELLFEIEGESQAGTPGTWKVVLDLYGVTGRIGMTFTGKP